MTPEENAALTAFTNSELGIGKDSVRSSDWLDAIVCGDNVEVLSGLPDASIDLTEWHLEYVGGEIYELEYCPAENCSTTVYRGNIPTREFFVALMSNVENAPKIDWANAAGERQPAEPLKP